MRITLVRHAESEANFANSYGSQTDTRLTDRGRRQCAFLAQQRDRFDGARIIASDLARATETLRLVLGSAVDATLEQVWRERDFGGAVGMPADATRARYPALFDFEGGGWFAAKTEDGESLADVDRRVRVALEEIVARDDSHVAVFTHGGPIQLSICAVLGLDPRTHMRRFNVENTAIATLQSSPWGIVVTGWNEVSHLPSEERTGVFRA